MRDALGPFLHWLKLFSARWPASPRPGTRPRRCIGRQHDLAAIGKL